MSELPPAGTVGSRRPTRRSARRAQTREALVAAAQAMIAEGRTEVSIAEITSRADVGLGSFYNHFSDKTELWDTALAVALHAHGQWVSALTAEIVDSAEVVCIGLRLTGRMTAQHPQLASVLLHTPVSKITADSALVARLRRDIEAAVTAGTFTLSSVDVAVAMAAGSVISLLSVLVQVPARLADELVDDLTARLLLSFGLKAAEALRLVALPLPNPDTSLPKDHPADGSLAPTPTIGIGT